MPLNRQSIALLQAIFGDAWERATVEWWSYDAAGKLCNPHAARARDATPRDDCAVYYTVGLMKPGHSRSNDAVEKVCVLVVDDVGTKVDVMGLTELPDPTYIVETSPGNFQWGWALKGGCDVETFRGLRRGLRRLGVKEAGAPSNLVRLPEGVNGKPGREVFTPHVVRLEAGLAYGADELQLGDAGLGVSGTGAPQKGDIGQIEELLKALPNDGSVDYDTWISVGMAVKGAVSEEGWEAWEAWSLQNPLANLKKDTRATWDSFEPHSAGLGALEIIVKERDAFRGMAGAVFDDGGGDPSGSASAPAVWSMADFWAHAPSGKYISVATGDLWPAVSVDGQVPVSGLVDGRGRAVPTSVALRRHRAVQQMSWVPGAPQIVRDMKVVEGGVMAAMGHHIYNKYMPPVGVEGGDPQAVLPWLAHVRKLYPEEYEEILDWMAHRIQKPGEKLNHALVLGGAQGIGKDTLLHPLFKGVGYGNFRDVRPAALMGRFNRHLMAVVLRVNEAHDLGEGLTRIKLYELMKTIVSSPPETLQIDEKGVEVYSIPNVVGVIITTNHKAGGLYLPEDDRRHFVAWSNKTASDLGGEAYFGRLWGWLAGGGWQNVVAFLRARDLSKFDASMPPRRTRHWDTIVQAGRSFEEDEIEDLVEGLGSPDVFALDDLLARASGRLRELSDKGMYRSLVVKIEGAGYEKVLCPNGSKGRWRVGKRWITIYGKRGVSLRELFDAAGRLHDRKKEEAKKAGEKFDS